MSTVLLLNSKSESFNVCQVQNPSTKLPISSLESFSFLAKEKVELNNRVVAQAFFQSFEGYDSSYFDDEKVFLLNELIEQSPLDLNFLSVNDFLLYELKKGLEDVHKIIQEFGSENLFRNSHLEKLEKLTLILTSNCGIDSVDFASTRYKVDFKKIALMQAKICSQMFPLEGLKQEQQYSSNSISNSDLAISIAKQLFAECHLFSQMLVEMQGVKGVRKIPLYDQKKKALDQNLLKLAQIIGLISSFTSSESGVDFFKTSSLTKAKFPLLNRTTSFSFEKKLSAFFEYVDHLKKVAEKYQSTNKSYHSKGSVFTELERKLKIVKREDNPKSTNKHLNDLINLLFEKSDEIETEFRSHIQKNGAQKTAREKQEYKEHLSYLSYLMRNLRGLTQAAIINLGFASSNLNLTHEEHTLNIADKFEELFSQKFYTDLSDPLSKKLEELKNEFFSDFHNSAAVASFDRFLANMKEDKNSPLTQREPIKALFAYIDTKVSEIKQVLSEIDKEFFLEVEENQEEQVSNWLNSLENTAASLKNYLFFSSEDSNCKSSAFLSDLIREKKESYSLSGLEEEFDDLSIYEEEDYPFDLGFEEPDFIDTDEEMEIEFELEEESELFMETMPSEPVVSKQEKSLSKFEIKQEKNQWMNQPYRISKRKQQMLEREKSFSGFDNEVDKKNLKIEKQRKQIKEPLITEEQAKILLSDDCIKRWKFLSTLTEYGMEKARSGHGSHQVWGPKNGKLTFPIPLGKDGMLSVGVRRNIVKALLGE